ncbi:SCP2 sterol-binding domain-containing protein [Pueribacillus sp. YX66]|uniref:SCP2 sterol-binding domain-containing protein n=1 Tax=Pueribacillus sp. YX66 TaxID=3229242 RepID=UPI00358D8AB2
MEEEIFSFSWVVLLGHEMKKGPTEERRSSVDPNYWNWINRCKQGLTLKLALVLRDEMDQFVYVDIVNGEVAHTYVGTEIELKEAKIVLSGTKEAWLEIVEGRKEPSQMIMTGKIKITNGSLSFFYKRIYYFSELLRCLTKC